MKEFKITPSMAYIIGVYFSDGSVTLNEKFRQWKFQIGACDLDYVEKVKNCFNELFGDVKTKILFRNPYGGGKKPVYHWHYTNRDFCEWLVNKTHERKIVPQEILDDHELGMQMLQGYMDGDGSIRIQVNFSVDFRGTNKDAIEGIAGLFKRTGMRIGKRLEYKTKKGTPLFGYSLNVQSFASSNFRFNIARKQERLNLFKFLGKSSTTLRQPLAKMMIDFFTPKKIESELTSDGEKEAEMTSSPLETEVNK